MTCVLGEVLSPTFHNTRLRSWMCGELAYEKEDQVSEDPNAQYVIEVLVAAKLQAQMPEAAEKLDKRSWVVLSALARRDKGALRGLFPMAKNVYDAALQSLSFAPVMKHVMSKVAQITVTPEHPWPFQLKQLQKMLHLWNALVENQQRPPASSRSAQTVLPLYMGPPMFLEEESDDEAEAADVATPKPLPQYRGPPEFCDELDDEAEAAPGRAAKKPALPSINEE